MRGFFENEDTITGIWHLSKADCKNNFKKGKKKVALSEKAVIMSVSLSNVTIGNKGANNGGKTKQGTPTAIQTTWSNCG